MSEKLGQRMMLRTFCLLSSMQEGREGVSEKTSRSVSPLSSSSKHPLCAKNRRLFAINLRVCCQFLLAIAYC